ncbi:MAG: sulfatase-like hydrolase/transferase [Planctomycetota bacterium]
MKNLLPVCASVICCLASLLHAAERPNIVFILTDDQSPHSLDAYGDQDCDTPNIDRIAAEGMCLTDAHHMGSWSGAVCTPSRTMIMTGRSVWHLPNMKRNKSDPVEIQQAAQQSLPAIFNAAGYDTFRTCKMGNSFDAANKLFAIRRDKSSRGGPNAPSSEWHGDQAMAYLEQREVANEDSPFFMYLGFSHPHDPRNAEDELAEKYGAFNTKTPPKQMLPDAPKLPINYLPAHPFHHGHRNLRDEVAVQGVLKDRSEATIRNEVGREYACIEYIDMQVGRVLDKLQAMGELENTYVFFTSDHGIAVGRHGLMGKQNLYEHCWKVPMLVRGPGIEAGSHASGYTYLMDMMPTLCDFADIETPTVAEGISFRPVLEGKQERVRDVLYGVYAGGSKPGMRAIKTDGWKLIKYDVLEGQVRETQLFDLRKNPYELLSDHHSTDVIKLTGNAPQPHEVDLAEDPNYAKKRAELEALLLAEQQRLDDPYRLWDQQ